MTLPAALIFALALPGPAAAWGPRAVWKIEGREALCLSITPDGKFAVSGSADGTLRLWDVAAGSATAVWGAHEEAVVGLGAFPDGTRLISAGREGAVKIWDLRARKHVASFQAHEGGLTAMALSRDGALLATASRDGTRRLWDLSRRAQLASLPGKGRASIVSAAFSPDGRSLLAAGEDGTARICEAGAASGGCYAYSVCGAAVSAYLPNGLGILSGCKDATLVLWAPAERLERIVLRGHAGRVTAVAVSTDAGTALTGAADDTVRLWDLAGRRLLATWEGHQGGVSAVAFSPDGRWGLSTGQDRTVKLWDVAAEIARVRDFEFGRRLASEGKFVAAKEVLARAVSADPDDAESRNWLASVQQDLQEHADAVATLRAIPADKRQLTWNYVLGRSLFELGRLDEARGALEAAAREPPGRNRGIDRGEVIRRFLSKLDVFGRALADGQAHLESGRPAEAVASLESALGELDNAQARAMLETARARLAAHRKRRRALWAWLAAALAAAAAGGWGWSARRRRTRRIAGARDDLAWKIRAMVAGLGGGSATAHERLTGAPPAAAGGSLDELRGLYERFQSLGGDPSTLGAEELYYIHHGKRLQQSSIPEAERADAAQALMEAGRDQEALTTLTEGRAAMGARDYSLALRLAARLGDFNLAARVFDGLSKTIPAAASPELYYSFALVCERHARLNEARAAYWQISQTTPGYRDCGQRLKQLESLSVRERTIASALARGTPLPPVAGRFQVRGLLGIGPHGITLLASEGAGPELALKVFGERLPQASQPWLLAAAGRQPPAAARPGLVAVLEALAAPEGVVLACEHVPGETVAEVITARGKIGVLEGARVLRFVCQTLADCHQNGKAHGDIRPSNIVLGRKGEVKLIDFGLARPPGSGMPEAQPPYAAPEGGALSTPAHDVFALGMLALEMATGRAAPDEPLPAGVPRWFSDLVTGCLNPGPQSRLKDAGQVLAGLPSL